MGMLWVIQGGKCVKINPSSPQGGTGHWINGIQ